MQCDYCDSKATVFFTQIIDGQTKKSSLCEKCATEHGVTDPEGFLIGHIQPIPKGEMKKIDIPTSQSPIPNTQVTKTCPSCEFTLDDLKSIGRLGCSQCYEFFRKEIKINLGGMHHGVLHTGRVPAGMKETFKKRQALEKLQSAMDNAIHSEDYEKAASLRDEINQLKKLADSKKSIRSKDSKSAI